MSGDDEGDRRGKRFWIKTCIGCLSLLIGFLVLLTRIPSAYLQMRKVMGMDVEAEVETESKTGKTGKTDVETEPKKEDPAFRLVVKTGDTKLVYWFGATDETPEARQAIKAAYSEMWRQFRRQASEIDATIDAGVKLAVLQHLDESGDERIALDEVQRTKSVGLATILEGM